MTPTQRKRHRQIWLALCILLPLGFVAAVLVLPQPVAQDNLYQPAVSGEPESEAPKDLKSPNDHE